MIEVIFGAQAKLKNYSRESSNINKRSKKKQNLIFSLGLVSVTPQTTGGCYWFAVRGD